MNVMMDGFGMFDVRTIGDYDRRSQGGTDELTRSIWMNHTYAKRIVVVAMDDNLRAAREM